eukprot:s549_g23.t1
MLGLPIRTELQSSEKAAEGLTASQSRDCPCVDPGAFREVSETLLLVAPEYAAVRALVLDYFASVRRSVTDDHIVFAFDKDMACSEGDVALAEQISLCLGLDAARRAAPQLWSGERPELLELFPELAWFRDTVFLWKMLLLPACECPPVQNWKASDSMLRWQYKPGPQQSRCFVPQGRTALAQAIEDWPRHLVTKNAQADHGNPSVLADCPAKGCALGEDQEERSANKVQDPLQPIPIHAHHDRQDQSREVEAVAATFPAEEGDLRNCRLGLEASCMMRQKAQLQDAL